jgi:glycosyltransferase involved in cell wall biosynthesis
VITEITNRSSIECLTVSVVTPTFRRPVEIVGMLENLSQQTHLPMEVIIVDGASTEERASEEAITPIIDSFPFRVRYIRHGGGTAIQRNVGIDVAEGDFISFIDDDVRLAPQFFQQVLVAFDTPGERRIGGIVGYRTNQHFRPEDRLRWRMYRRLNLLKTFEPGAYDFECGYPVNNNMQPPFAGVRKVNFMTTACAVWRREVLDSGLRFDTFFSDYGMLEDAHFSLRAGRRWELLQCGDAHCEELSSRNGREDRRKIGYKCVVNYYYVFRDIVGPLTWRHQVRFWRYQAFELLRIGTSAIRRMRAADVHDLRGRLEGMFAVARGTGFPT